MRSCWTTVFITAMTSCVVLILTPYRRWNTGSTYSKWASLLGNTLGPDLQTVLRQSYDHLMIMPKLRFTYDGCLTYKTCYEEWKTFLRYYSRECTCSALTLLVGWQEGHPACKNWVVGCWHGYLSGVRCRLAYCPADATATHCLLHL